MRHSKAILLAVFALMLTFVAMPRSVTAQTQYAIQVGASGDDASVGNIGVGAEISTSITPPIGEALATSFWIGDNLQDGAFVQFGYDLTTPHSYCLYGERIGDQGKCLGALGYIGYDDARWFWQYWPNSAVNDFYYAMGPANSAGPDGSWHLYQISPNATNGWNFVLDGKTVWNLNLFQVTKSRDPAYMIAEEVTSTQSASGRLGPVAFRNLSYLDDYKTWQPVTSLSAISGCGGMILYCGITVPYGVTVSGPNEIIVGTGQQLTQSGSPLWPQAFKLTVSAPSKVQVTIDGSSYFGGSADVPLLQGPHSISAPELVEIDSTNRLRFVDWSDGSTEFNRTINLNSDMHLQANYIQQYKLTIVSSSPSSGGEWYNQGTVADFETNTSPYVTNTLGLTIFGGWHNENGALITTWGSGSIEMDQPNTVEAYWLPLNYLVPIIVSALFGFACFFKVARSKR
jgi:hypothetical protein